MMCGFVGELKAMPWSAVDDVEVEASQVHLGNCRIIAKTG